MRKLLLASAAVLGTALTAGTANAQPAKQVAAPGSIVVHLKGYLQFSVVDSGSTFNNYNGYKLNPISTAGDIRLYPGFDAETLGGLMYGAQVELRTTTSNAGKGVNSNSTNSNGSGNMYVRRAYGYIGTPDYGFGRFGQTDSAFTLLQTGVVESFGDGAQWTSDGGPVLVLPTNASPGNFVYADQGALYTTDKLVYISPKLEEPLLGGAFSGAFGYEPNSNGIKEGYAGCSAAASGCAALTSSSTASDIGTRRRNTVDVAVMYAVKAAGFASKFNFGYLTGAPINYTGATPAYGTSALHYGYDNLSVWQLGGQTTFAGLTVGANVKGGAVEDGYAFKPKGARNGLTYIVGASYELGPYVLGASYFNGQTAGTYYPGKAEAKTLSEYGVAVGGNYVVAKPLSLFLEYMYGHRHQPGNGFGATPGRDNTQVQLVALGATMKW